MREKLTTPTPWRVREMNRRGEVHGYFIAANDVNGFAYDAEIMGEDEYRDIEGKTPGLERWKADAEFIVRAVNSHDALVEALRVARRYVADLPILGDEDLAVIDAALEKAEAQS